MTGGIEIGCAVDIKLVLASRLALSPMTSRSWGAKSRECYCHFTVWQVLRGGVV
jgi:hypothetical protein